MIITPSLLEKNTNDLLSNLLKLAPYFQSFQIDIADGVDSPNTTIQINEIMDMFIKNKNLFINTEFEFHLMVANYEPIIKKTYEMKNFIKVRDVLVHAKYLPDINSLIIQNSFPIGLVLYPEDSVEIIINNYRLDDIQYIQIMSCRVGFKGTPFIPEAMNKIEQLRIANYRNIISLDGAISNQTLPLILAKKYKPDILCPDSYLVFADDLKKRVDYLKEVMEKAD